MSSRRRGRELALQILYQLDMVRADVNDAIRAFWELQESIPSEDTKEFCEDLARGASEHSDEIDRLIEDAASNWRISRMAVVDRNILRLAVYELLYREDIPSTVTINEAIELGKMFGTEESGAFINGVLDKIAERIPESISKKSLPPRH